MSNDPSQRADMEVVQYLLDHRGQVHRNVKQIAGGVQATTESDTPAVGAQLRAHVAAMYRRMKEGRLIHARDPLFAALFGSAEKIVVTQEQTAKGIKVSEISTDLAVAKLIRAHARVVGAFLTNGRSEMMKDHATQ